MANALNHFGWGCSKCHRVSAHGPIDRDCAICRRPCVETVCEGCGTPRGPDFESFDARTQFILDTEKAEQDAAALVSDYLNGTKGELEGLDELSPEGDVLPKDEELARRAAEVFAPGSRDATTAAQYDLHPMELDERDYEEMPGLGLPGAKLPPWRSGWGVSNVVSNVHPLRRPTPQTSESAPDNLLDRVAAAHRALAPLSPAWRARAIRALETMLSDIADAAE